MITFYDKTSGNIIGTIEGRIHSEDQLKMWIGDKEKTERIIVNWKKISKHEFTPDCDDEQKTIYIELDKNPSAIFKYKVDTKTKRIILL